MMDRELQLMTYWEMWRRAAGYNDKYSMDLWSRAIERCLEC